jgi:hypothetical protein
LKLTRHEAERPDLFVSGIPDREQLPFRRVDVPMASCSNALDPGSRALPKAGDGVSPLGAPLRTITKAQVVLRSGFYWQAFEFDDGSKWEARAASKLEADFQTRDRIGDVVLLSGSPLLRR